LVNEPNEARCSGVLRSVDADGRRDLPDDQTLVRLAGMLCIEQNDEWLVGQGYLWAESITQTKENASIARTASGQCPAGNPCDYRSQSVTRSRCAAVKLAEPGPEAIQAVLGVRKEQLS
jgi:hypothetical protein